jgi:hypothetical protein
MNKDQQIESLELTLAQWQTEEPNSERGVRIIKELQLELELIELKNETNKNTIRISEIEKELKQLKEN